MCSSITVFNIRTEARIANESCARKRILASESRWRMKSRKVPGGDDATHERFIRINIKESPEHGPRKPISRSESPCRTWTTRSRDVHEMAWRKTSCRVEQTSRTRDCPEQTHGKRRKTLEITSFSRAQFVSDNITFQRFHVPTEPNPGRHELRPA